jgi:branched-chain amino acid aminotransferase
MVMDISTRFKTVKTKNSKLDQIDWEHLEFGKYVSDHMFVCDYIDGEWKEPSILPFENLSISPVALALHYGQSIFEGMKAFYMADGGINIFRIKKHHERLNRSLERMCMPSVPREIFEEGLMQLVQMDREWVPKKAGAALYLRPFVFASEARFGVKIAEEYKFIIVTGPVPTLYQKPIRVKVERQYIRAAKGGTGFAKCAGNYGGVFYPTQLAKKEGFDAVIWTDANEHEYLEESGVMNLMFVIDGKLVTPPLSDSILDGITRDSLLTIARDMKLTVEERPVTLTEIKSAFKESRITEAFGAGTAAVVAPISEINIDGVPYLLPDAEKNTIMLQLKERLENIRSGRGKDNYLWNCII